MYISYWLDICKKIKYQSICVEFYFRFYAVVSVQGTLFEKTMKNPLFRAYYEEINCFAQGRFLKVCTGENQKFILVSAQAQLCAVVEQRGMLYE